MAKAKFLKTPYDRRTEATRERLFPFDNWVTDKVYKQPDGLYVYKNQKGYIHILKPRRVNVDEKFSHYTIVDILLTAQDTLKEGHRYGIFITREECILKIEERM